MCYIFIELIQQHSQKNLKTLSELKKIEQRKKKAIPRRFTKINVVRKQCWLEALRFKIATLKY